MSNILRTIGVHEPQDCTIQIAGPGDLDEIVELQRKHLMRNLSPEDRCANGYVSLETPRPYLDEITSALPTIIARIQGKLAGYRISMALHHAQQAPFLEPVMARLENLKIDAKPLDTSNCFFGAQVCVDNPHRRGAKLVTTLYEMARLQLLEYGYKYGVTEVSAANHRSMRNLQHNVGCKELERFNDPAGQEWVIFLFDLSKKTLRYEEVDALLLHG